jgi:formylmethanofuran dehydrogenase subunit D
MKTPDTQFGDYKELSEKDWGEKLTYVKEILKDKKGKTTGYIIDREIIITVSEAIRRAEMGKLDNVVVKNKNGTIFLRSKKNKISSDNFT